MTVVHAELKKKPMPSSSISDEVSDLLAAVLFFGADPDAPPENWSVLAARFYASAGVLLSPSEVETFFFYYIDHFGGVAAAIQNVEDMVKANVAAGTASRFQRVCAILVPNFATAPSAQKLTSSQPSTLSSSSQYIQSTRAGDAVAGAALVFGALSSTSSSTTAKPLYLRPMSPDHLLEIIQLFRAVEGFDVFEDPVGPRVVNTVMSSNNYAMVIKDPMSVSRMRQLVREGNITTLQDLECAVWKIAMNCVFFNVPEGRYPGLGRRFACACSVIIHREAGLVS